MPRGDQTGPMGQGPKTGRGAGKCSGSKVPGFVSAPGGGGAGGGGGGRGRGGGGRGRRNRFQATGLTGEQRDAVTEVTEPVTPPPVTVTEVTEEQEIELLKAQANDAVAKFEQIQQRIDELAAGRSRDSATEHE